MPKMNETGASVTSLPLGIALLAALLSITGLGSMAAGIYLFFASPTVEVWAAVIALVAGPAILYLVLHILRRSPWAWRALIAAFVLLLASSIVRLAVTPGVPIAPIGEIVIEGIALYYLSRGPIRSHFRGAPA